MSGERTIRDAIRRADASVPDELTADPDTIIDRDCKGCEGKGTIRFPGGYDGNCPDCEGTGREVVNVIVAVTPEVVEWLAEFAVPNEVLAMILDPAVPVNVVRAAMPVLIERDRKALKIGRAVLGTTTQPRRIFRIFAGDYSTKYADDYHRWLLAQGEAR